MIFNTPYSFIGPQEDVLSVVTTSTELDVEQELESIINSVGIVPLGLPTKWENSPQPNAGSSTTGVRASVFILPGETDLAEFGSPNRSFRGVGVAIIQLFCPAGIGKISIREAAKTLLAYFRGQTYGSIRFNRCYPQKIGEDGAEFQLNVVLNYSHDFYEEQV